MMMMPTKAMRVMGFVIVKKTTQVSVDVFVDDEIVGVLVDALAAVVAAAAAHGDTAHQYYDQTQVFRVLNMIENMTYN